jgi:hypothetical protein
MDQADELKDSTFKQPINNHTEHGEQDPIQFEVGHNVINFAPAGRKNQNKKRYGSYEDDDYI